MDIEKKQKILTSIAGIPTQSIANYILRGEVTSLEVINRLQELHRDDKIAEINGLLAADDDKKWSEAVAQNTPIALASYKNTFPTGRHISECEAMLAQLDNNLWSQLSQTMTESSLNRYLSLYPNGAHAQECRDMLADLPWLEARTQGTIAAMQQYQMAHPGQHVQEIAQIINDLSDETDWRNAEAMGTTYAYNAYLEKHPTGAYATLAQNAVLSRAGREQIISELTANINAYSAFKLKENVDNMLIGWNDLSQVFTPEEIDAIQQLPNLTILPEDSLAPPELAEGTTEVYFWGTPSSGKTCALGAILSAANSYGILTKETCNAAYYMDRLCSTFNGRGICNLPAGSSDNVIQEMRLSLRDAKRKQHPLTLIDVAGETFRAMYRRQNNIPESSPLSAAVLEQMKQYLTNEKNKKIHFFIVGYGEDDKRWEGENVPMVNYLESSMDYLRQERIVRKSTNGVYLLVTKADMMPCAPEQRQEFAEQYVRETMPSFYNSLMDICRDSGVRDFQVLPFSVGRVFAQTLCHFERDNTDEVLNRLIAKSATKKGGWINFFNS